MSWLFGSKKKVVPSPQTVPPATIEVKEEDDFVHVNNFAKPNGLSDPPPLYPLIPGLAAAGTSYPNGAPQAATSPPQPLHQLHGVPFRLSKDTSLLAMSQQSHQFVVQRAQAAINNVDSSAFRYDFAVERSVLKETENF